MSKTLKTVGIVLGAAALLATGVGAVMAAAGAATFLGVSAGTFATIGTIASLPTSPATLARQLKEYDHDHANRGSLHGWGEVVDRHSDPIGQYA